MPGDGNTGWDVHPLHFLIVVALTRPGGEQIAPMLFPISIRRHASYLSLFIHMQDYARRHTRRAQGGLDRMGIDGLPLDG
jgi:hypothetical protein